MEIQAGWSFLPRWSIGGHATYTFGQNTTANEPLRRIPPLKGRAYVASLLLSNLDLRAETVFAHAQRRLAKSVFMMTASPTTVRPAGRFLTSGLFISGYFDPFRRIAQHREQSLPHAWLGRGMGGPKCVDAGGYEFLKQ